MQLFDPDVETEKGKRAADAAADNAHATWVAQFMLALKAVIREKDTFTTADVLAHMPVMFPRTLMSTHEPRAIGGLMRRAATERWCYPTMEYRKTGSHGRPQRVWKGSLKGGPPV